MTGLLDNMRNTKISTKRQIVYTAGIMLAGVMLGIISKYLDCAASNELPFIIEYLDVRNFLGRFSIWVFIALCISVYSASPARAAINVFVFFMGAVTSYYLYSKFIAGFLPINYAMIWAGFTAVSPLLAFICWYSKGKGKISFIISAGIIAVMFNMTFAFGWIYFGSLLDLLVFICGVIVVRRATVRETVAMIFTGVIFAFIIKMVLFHLI